MTLPVLLPDEIFDGLPFRPIVVTHDVQRWALVADFGGILLEKRDGTYKSSVVIYGVCVHSYGSEDPHKVVCYARNCLNSIRGGINELLPPPPPEPSKTLTYR